MFNATMRVAAFVFAILLAAGPGVAAGEPDVEQQAIEAAEAWLALVDTGRFDDSWEAATDTFRKAVKKDQWRDAVSAVRGPLGGLVSREVESAEYRTTLPGAPDGEYVVIQFAASFEHKKSAVETVTPMRDPDGTWRVSGYYIR
jgi:hypothetical protein